jgi:hypothetical protein
MNGPEAESDVGTEGADITNPFFIIAEERSAKQMFSILTRDLGENQKPHASHLIFPLLTYLRWLEDVGHQWERSVASPPKAGEFILARSKFRGGI